jgi:hypothetical protein
VGMDSVNERRRHEVLRPSVLWHLAFLSLCKLKKLKKATKKLRSHFGPGLKKSWPPTEAAVKHKKLKAVKSD